MAVCYWDIGETHSVLILLGKELMALREELRVCAARGSIEGKYFPSFQKDCINVQFLFDLPREPLI